MNEEESSNKNDNIIKSNRSSKNKHEIKISDLLKNQITKNLKEKQNNMKKRSDIIESMENNLNNNENEIKHNKSKTNISNINIDNIENGNNSKIYSDSNNIYNNNQSNNNTNDIISIKNIRSNNIDTDIYKTITSNKSNITHKSNITNISNNTNNIHNISRIRKNTIKNPIFTNRRNRIVNENIDISDTEFNKLIFPYNFETKSYEISEDDIEFYEGKEYILNKLKEINNDNIFKIDSKYNPNFCQNFILVFPIFLIMLILLYFEFLLINILSYNPIVIYLSIVLAYKIFAYCRQKRNKIMDKFKNNKIKDILELTNNSQFCIEHHLKWSYGLCGYWLEIQKIT